MKTKQIREQFLNYFKSHAHEIVSSSSLVPENDPTLLFTNAGMNQFKDVFLGREKRDYVRATTVQKCVRAGGKHNDLENVGFTARHHTFFEMLGNFSFGDYFKKEAIFYAWDFLTGVLNIPKEKLWITVFEKDDEAADIWIEKIGVDPKRLSRCGEKDNFWAMGDTGPCGPCSEIYYDHGEDFLGDPPGLGVEGDRYVEIWNLVFMQYNRDISGNLIPLPKPSVDTGMGLERIAAVMQGVHSNFDIDLFRHLIQAIAALAKTSDIENPALKVIADHIRASSFLIADGVTPSNEGRGYVLRRIIRRAIRYGNQIGFKEPFFYRLVPSLIEAMGEAYPSLPEHKDFIENILRQEEKQFAKTLELGLKILEEAMQSLKEKTIPGEIVFKLYDTYGFPSDLTALIAKEKGYQVDEKGFEEAMEKQREQSQATGQFKVDYTQLPTIDSATEFVGYSDYSVKTKVIALLFDGKLTDKLLKGQPGIVVLDRTPFYAESGGQVGDKGHLEINKEGVFTVQDTQKLGSTFLHVGILQSDDLCVGATVKAVVNGARRDAISRNHSATHLLHGALRDIVGEAVFQKGSLVDEARLRFDFSSMTPLSKNEIIQIEDWVNDKIRKDLIAEIEVTTPEKAKKMGAMALFGEKYGDRVRVIKFDDASAELCGGTHVDRTGKIGMFKILSECGIASGIRRIEAVTGDNVMNLFRQKETVIGDVCAALKTDEMNVLGKLDQLIKNQKQLEKEMTELKIKLASGASQSLLEDAKMIGDVKCLSKIMDGADTVVLRDLIDQLKSKVEKGIFILAGKKEDNTAHLIVGVTKNITDRFNAGNILKELTGKLGGKGGGRPDLAQGSIENVNQLSTAVEEHLKCSHI